MNGINGKGNDTKKSKKKTALIILTCIIGAVLLALLVFFVTLLIMRERGKASFGGSPAPNLNDFIESAGDENDNNKGENNPQKPDFEYDIYYDGSYYKYKSNIITLLFMGVDREKPFVKNELYGNGGQSDVIILAVIDRDNKKISFISVSRDVMTDIETYDIYGNHISTVKKQLTLQFAYGDGYTESCRMTAEAVSNLFFGVTIDGYCAMSMGAIAPLNDSVGGVEVTLKSDFTDISPNMKKGATVLLLGDVAYKYLRTRPEETNAERLERQKNYLSAFSVKLREKIKSNIMFVATVYSSVKNYVLTNFSLSELLYIASETVNMDMSDEIYTLEGEYVTEGEHAEFYADKWAMFRLILSLYYDKVG